MRLLIFFLLFLVLSGCSSSPPDDPSSMQEIQGRDYDGKRFEVYRVRVSPDWIRRDPLPNESLSDTTKALCEFLIKDEGGIIRIAIHNFPSESIDQRIPPAAQVARWRQQFEKLLPSDSYTAPQAFSGYSGLLFKGVGTLNGQEMAVLGWSLQIAPEHYRSLSYAPKPEMQPLYREMRADMTIKATGPKTVMQLHEDEISRFARSFELIEEIPPLP